MSKKVILLIILFVILALMCGLLAVLQLREVSQDPVPTFPTENTETVSVPTEELVTLSPTASPTEVVPETEDDLYTAPPITFPPDDVVSEPTEATHPQEQKPEGSGNSGNKPTSTEPAATDPAPTEGNDESEPSNPYDEDELPPMPF